MLRTTPYLLTLLNLLCKVAFSNVYHSICREGSWVPNFIVYSSNIQNLYVWTFWQKPLRITLLLSCHNQVVTFITYKTQLVLMCLMDFLAFILYLQSCMMFTALQVRDSGKLSNPWFTLLMNVSCSFPFNLRPLFLSTFSNALALSIFRQEELLFIKHYNLSNHLCPSFISPVIVS